MMQDKWQELRETIQELHDNNPDTNIIEIMQFLLNYMDVLDKQN